MQPSPFRAGVFLALMTLPASVAGQQSAAATGFEVITADQITRSQANTAFDVIERLRPGFMRRAERPQTVFGGAATNRVAVSPVGRGNEADRMLSTDRSQLDGTDSDVGRAGSLKVLVFVDGSRLGDVRELKRIPAGEVRQIRFLSAPDAQQKYGAGAAAGAIQVVLKSTD